MYTQRIILAVLGTLGMGVCLVPWGHEPVLSPLTGTGPLQLVAAALCLLVLILSFVGPGKKGILKAWNVWAALAILLIFIAGVTRIVLVGHYWIPKFDEDDPRAKDYYEHVCSAGVIKGCVLLGTCYWTGTCGQNRDVGRALELYEKACDTGEISACGQLGVCYELGGCGVARNTSRAIAMYEKACAGGEMDMCNNLGVCYHKGQCGVGRDPSRARELYGKACDSGYSGACHNLGLLHD